MRKTAKKILLIGGLAYAALFAFSAFHLPSTTKLYARQSPLNLIFMPLYTVPILRAYATFAWHGVWPFGDRAGVLDLNAFIDENGTPSVIHDSKEVTFDLNPEIPPGQEGRAVISLGSAYYSMGFYGASYDVSGGTPLSLGRYHCLISVGSLSSFVGPPHCYEIIEGEDGAIYRKSLGSQKAEPIKLVP